MNNEETWQMGGVKSYEVIDQTKAVSDLSAAAGSHTCEECQGLLDGYFTGRMHKDGFYVRMECQKCGKEDNVRFYFANSPVLASEGRGS